MMGETVGQRVARVFATSWGTAAAKTWNRHRSAVRSFGAWASVDDLAAGLDRRAETRPRTEPIGPAHLAALWNRPDLPLRTPDGGSRRDGAALREPDARGHDVGSMFDEVRLAPAWTAALDREADAVGAIVGTARARGQRVLAGGVETDEQRRALVDLGCERLSGHLIGEPQAEPG